jgi:hypothetical protein
MSAPAITLETPVEELLDRYPAANGFLMRNHVICIVCGEAFWGTLGELFESKGIADPEELLARLNAHLAVEPA